MTMTGMSIPFSFKRRSSSIPVISGIRTSVMTHPGSNGLMEARKVVPFHTSAHRLAQRAAEKPASRARHRHRQ
jgi:hypothetical protein